MGTETNAGTAAGGSVISLPKGGGAIAGLGETFAPDLFTGTGNYSVPITIPAGRHGMQPDLTLGYSTGNGNGPFGLGWRLSLPGVSRKTSHGIPRYGDDDVFVLSGAEDLVPVAGAPTGRVRYRPRTEGLFARIEHVKDAANDFWEVRTKDGLLTRYGTPRPAGAPDDWRDPAVVADPLAPGRVFAWRITESADPIGNLVRYEYLPDAGREPGHDWDQPLLSRVSYVDYGDPADPSFLVTVNLEYDGRPDPFSEHRPGFEVRTSLRCTLIRVTTHPAGGVAQVSREYRLGYRPAPFTGVSLLETVTPVGIDVGTEEMLPPLTFTYSGFDPAGRRFAPLTGPGLPTVALNAPNVSLVDLRGVGLPDVVEFGAAPRFWHNLGGGRFDLPRAFREAPPFTLGQPGVALLDADGDGRPDLVVSARGTAAGSRRLTADATAAGYFPMTFSGGWSQRSFQAYRQAPTVTLTDTAVKLVDLDGDGLTDVLRSGGRLEAWFNHRDPRQAWQRTAVSDGVDSEIDIDLSDPRIRLADMTGDGLSDLVLVRNGNIAYWPSLGHGRWGSKVIMRDSPRLPVDFDPRRLLLGDVDGDGAADLIYVDNGRISLWGNMSGNGWTPRPVTITGTPSIVDTGAVQLADVYGNGMAGLLYSAVSDGTGRNRPKFLDFTGGVKPHLLTGVDNHLGSRITVRYRSSTQEFLRDAVRPATRWRTTLPFPVQVVSSIEINDQISGGRLTTEYRYHHGYWDGVEREFRGFGMVEHRDTEMFTGGEHFSPPTLSKSWFHLGPVAAAQAGDWTELDLRDEYWQGDPSMLSRPAQTDALLARLSRTERRSALRSLRGQVLRTELYAVDGTDLQALPYTVTEAVSGLREESSGVYFPFAVGQRTTQWERGDDPMTRFTFPDGYDAFGFAATNLEVAVPRGRDPRVADASAGQPYLATYDVTEYARRDDPGRYLINRVSRATSYEVVNDGVMAVAELVAALRAGVPVVPDDPAPGDPGDPGDGPGGPAGGGAEAASVPLAGAVSLRLIGHSRTFYDGPDFLGLPLGTLGDNGLPTRVESLAFTGGFLRQLFDPLPPYLDPAGAVPWPAHYPQEFRDALPALAGYLHCVDTDVPGSPGGFYAVTARHRYGARGLSVASLDPLGAESRVDFDQHDLLPVRTVDPAGLETTAVHDYRVLQPREITDVNGNTATVTFSPAGLVIAHSVRGKDGEGDATAPSVQLTYDLLAFDRNRQPASVRTVRRLHHDTDTGVPPDQRDEVLVSVEYSDGFERLLQVRAQAEDTVFGDPVFGGGVIPGGDLTPVGDTAGRARAPGDPDNVVVSGWQVYDNKGRVVQKYEPFFATGYGYSPPAEAQLGQKTTTFYDPRGQVIRTVNPDGSEQRVLLGVPADLTDPDRYAPTPWESYIYDPNDNAGRTHGEEAQPYQEHWNTPASIEVDALGRIVRAVARNGATAAERFTTLSEYDIQGNLLSIVDPLGRAAMSYRYDLANRRWHEEGIDAGRHDGVPDVLGNPVEGRDGKGALTLGAFDLLRRPIRTWARDDGAGPVTLRQVLEYGDAGTPEQPPADRDAARRRNLLRRLVRHYDEAGLVTLAAADFKGNLLESDRRVIADAPILATYVAAAGNAWRVTPFRVDWTGGPDALLESTRYVTTTSYDALNRVVAHRLPSDVDGSRAELRPVYNRAGALEAVQLDGTTYVQRIVYDAKGQRALVALGNGTMTRYGYDPRTFRLVRLRSEQYTCDGLTYHPAGQVWQDRGYDYDVAGNLVAIRDRAPGSGIPNNPEALTIADPVLRALVGGGDALNRRFGYDPLYRLLTATGREHQSPPAGDPWQDLPRGSDVTMTQAYQESYGYDAAGNLLTLTHTGAAGRTFTNTPGNNRLQRMTIGTTPSSPHYDYTFDAAGNLLTETSARHFSWNHDDQLVAFATQTAGAEPSVHAQYLYDSSGRRVKKLVRRQGGAVDVTHYLDGTFEHHRWSGGQNNHVHVMDDRQRVALVRIGPAHPDDGGPAVAVHLPDHLGSSTVVLDGTGALTNREEFTPYGETSFGSFTRKRYRFTGMERDEESGLSHHGARYCLPWLARWASCDPIGAKGGLNQYAYAACNPVTLYDPEGTQPREAEVKEPDAKRASNVEHISPEELQQRKEAGGGKYVTVPAGKRPFERSTARTAVEVFWTGGRSEKADARYDSLGPDQTWAREIMDKRWGCTGCHVTTEVWNRLGPSAVAPNGLPYDWAINRSGFQDWVLVSTLTRAGVQAGVGAAQFGQATFLRQTGGVPPAAPAPLSQGATPTARGTATVSYAGSHASIEVNHGGKSVHTHRLGAPGTGTQPAYFNEAVAPNARRITVDVPDAAGAQRYQHRTIGQQQGAYDLKTNSCLTYCGDVLKAGGLNPPGTSVDLAKWLLSQPGAGGKKK